MVGSLVRLSQVVRVIDLVNVVLVWCLELDDARRGLVLKANPYQDPDVFNHLELSRPSLLQVVVTCISRLHDTPQLGANCLRSLPIPD